MSKKLIIINGSCAGENGNSAELLRQAIPKLLSKFQIEQIELKGMTEFSSAKNALENADAFIMLTGTYWDSWGSPLQFFLEQMSETEGSKIWLGKPLAVIVTMNSVGGKGVLSRLQGVMNTFGVMIPPCSGVVYSTVNQLALSAGPSPHAEDFWRPEDIETVVHNLAEACAGTKNWKFWPTDKEAFKSKWITK